MKNTLKISAVGEDLISSMDDDTNRLFINDAEIPSSSWTGTGSYTATVEGHEITILKVEDTDGNIGIKRTSEFNYQLYKHQKSGEETTDYEELINKPQIEGVTLIGNKTFSDLTLDRITNSEINYLLTQTINI